MLGYKIPWPSSPGKISSKAWGRGHFALLATLDLFSEVWWELYVNTTLKL